MKTIKLLSALLLLFTFAFSAAAQSQQGVTPVMKAHLTMIEKMADKKDITPEQKEKLISVIQERNNQIEALAAKKLDDASYKEELFKIASEANRQMNKIFTKDQVKIWGAYCNRPNQYQ